MEISRRSTCRRFLATRSHRVFFYLFLTENTLPTSPTKKTPHRYSHTALFQEKKTHIFTITVHFWNPWIRMIRSLNNIKCSIQSTEFIRWKFLWKSKIEFLFFNCRILGYLVKIILKLIVTQLLLNFKNKIFQNA